MLCNSVFPSDQDFLGCGVTCVISDSFLTALKFEVKEKSSSYMWQ